ncbi:hypothetical protein QFZ51_002351 [Chitinophaga sp. W3I9]|uniref:hypothetical protein n=1 Tax=Chitinophaga sp. W3I9 TaxID=3373924 RepID=UPI003D1B4405
MAKQTGLLQFTGKLGNVIGYRRNGTYFLRSMPDAVRQTTATRRASRDFGVASRKGKLIRQAIVPRLEINPCGTLVNRLNKALITATKDRLTELKGFRFNPYAGVDQFFSHQPVENRRSKAADIIAVMAPAATKKQPVKVNKIPHVKRVLPYHPLPAIKKTTLPVSARQRE